ncbi:MAG: hypothetical protein QM784_09415 [Polyangiaceae bacterium]
MSDLELEIPAKLRVDELGQLRASVVREVGEKDAVARLRFRVSHTPTRIDKVPTLATQSLRDFSVLTDTHRNRLAEYRIFSGEDLLRATRNAAGYRSVESILGKETLHNALQTAEVASMPGVSAEWSTAFLRGGVKSLGEFLGTPAEEIAKRVSDTLGDSVPTEAVADLQQRIAKLRSPPWSPKKS